MPVIGELGVLVVREFIAHFGPQFPAARDLTALVNDWLFVQIFPDHRGERIAQALPALRIALHTLWRIPSLEGEADLAKIGVRVKASTTTAPSVRAPELINVE